MKAKKWVGLFCLTVVVLVAVVAAFNYITDPFGAFGDKVLQWDSFNMTNNPRVAKISYLEEHHTEYDSYIIGCSSTSSFPTEAFNRLYDASFYNLVMYDADMLDCEKIAAYLVEHYTVKNLILNVYIDNGITYDEESNNLTKNLHHATDPDTSAMSYYSRYLFANPQFGIAKLQATAKDTELPQSFDVFDAATGTYDKRLRDTAPIGSTESYVQEYAVFTNYPTYGPYGLFRTADCMASVAAIRDLCSANGVNLVVVAGPVYKDYFQSFAPETVVNFYTALAEVTPYWNFASSSVSCEPRYFYDATHFRNNVGEMMAAKMGGSDEVWVPEDFGAYVTKETAADYMTEALQAVPQEKDAQVPILMYHHLAEEGDNASTMSVAAFEAQIKALAEAGYTAVTFDDLQAFVNEGGSLPEKPVVITFDDGYTSNYDIAYPILKQYGMKATIFVIGVSVGKDTYKDTDHAMTPHFSFEQAQEMMQSGVISIQSHTYDMHQWPPFESGTAVRENILPLPGESEQDYVAAVMADFTESRRAIEEALGEPVDVVAYPTGAYSDLAQVTLQQLGVEVTLTTNPGINTIVRGLPQSLMALKRFGMNDTVSVEEMLDMIG